MGLELLILPKDYNTSLDIIDTEVAIKLAKDTFERKLARRLGLVRVSAPLFVKKNSGLNDDLNGTERAVGFDIKETADYVEIVHSLAKWKRMALKKYGFDTGKGLYADMNAIRRDEDLDNLHSVYVDQWDWEKIITEEQRTTLTLTQTVEEIVRSLTDCEQVICDQYSTLTPYIEQKVKFITSQELEDLYPTLTGKQREDAICKEYKTVFILQIGDVLASGEKHDGRAPDYDDWKLNGDLLIWYPILNRSVELSSMGIRVSPQSLKEQLEKANCIERSELDFHKQLLNGELPYTMGGGIGQSRICMILLQKAHIGEVQSAIWSNDMIEVCKQKGINLL